MDTQKTISGFPLSIGTGIALESIFKPILEVYDDNIKVDKVDINKFHTCYISVYTLIRNIVSAYPTEYKNKILGTKDKKFLLKEVASEIDTITELFNEVKCNVYFYALPYMDIVSKLDNSFFKKSKASQLDIEMLYKQVVDLLIKGTNGLIKSNILPNNNPSLIMTHTAIDLLKVSVVPNLSLLESHTGRVKDKSKFNTKYYKAAKFDMTIFPFTERLCCIFGDRHYIRPAAITFRKDIYNVATLKKWTPFTSESKIIQTLYDANPELSVEYKKFKLNN